MATTGSSHSHQPAGNNPQEGDFPPYAERDPDRLDLPKHESEWGCEDFKKKWYKDQDILIFQEALHANENEQLTGFNLNNHNNNSTASASSSLSSSHSSNQPESTTATTTATTTASNRSHSRCRNSSAPKRNRAVRPRKDIVREGWAYHISRWPLLTLIGLAFLVEFLIYISVRQIVRLFESMMSWRALEGRLRRKLQSVQTYDEWKQTALELDELLGFEQWKTNSTNAYYDYNSVRKVVTSLERSRNNNDAETLKGVLEVCLRANFAGIESSRLYSQSHLGTKTLIETYVDEVEKSINYIRQTNLLSAQEKTVFFRRTAKNLGTSALCLSGGATFGFYHFGVIRALLDARLLPTVITGTSAGSLIAAFLCTHTDEELDRLLVPELADMITACEDPISVWIPRIFKTGARFDTVLWAKKSCFFTMGSMTFLEAYERTGRILNVSVIPHDLHSPTTLLNYITAPNCVIFSAVLASAAVPLVLNPIVLLEKTKEGKVRPWQFQGKHKDGSLRVDVPLESLHLYFNTSFSIVSQVNPHVHLFFFQPRGAPGQPVAHRKGKGWRGGFFLSALEQYMKIELIKNLRVIRDLELLPTFGGPTFTAVFLQRFEGTVTIWPQSRFRDWFNILTDPDRKELARMMDVGKRVTWPKIRMIENRLRIERQVFMGRLETKKSQEPTIPNPRSERDMSVGGRTKVFKGLVDVGTAGEEGTTSGFELERTMGGFYETDSELELERLTGLNLKQHHNKDRATSTSTSSSTCSEFNTSRDRRKLDRLSQASQTTTVGIINSLKHEYDDDHQHQPNTTNSKTFNRKNHRDRDRKRDMTEINKRSGSDSSGR